MLENINFKKNQISSEKNFAIVFSIFFLLIFLYQFFFYNEINLILLLFSAVILFIGFIFPKLLFIPNKIWFKFGTLLSFITNPIIMFLLFFFGFCSMKLLLLLFGKKDITKRKINKNLKSYWIKRENKFNSMKNQF